MRLLVLNKTLVVKKKYVFKREEYDDEWVEGVKPIGKGRGRRVRDKQGDALLSYDTVRASNDGSKVSVAGDAVVKQLAPQEFQVLKMPVSMEDNTEEKKTEQKTVWYEGIIKDLYTATDKDLDKDKRNEAITRLRTNGVKMPDVTENEFDRVKIRSTLLILSGGNSTRWGKPEMATNYLKNELLIDKKTKSPVAVEEEKTISKNEVVELLTKLSNSANSKTDLESAISGLEVKSVAIKKFLDGVEKEVPGKKSDILLQLRAVLEIWKMEPEGRKKYPKMTKIAELYAQELGLGMI